MLLFQLRVSLNYVYTVPYLHISWQSIYLSPCISSCLSLNVVPSLHSQPLPPLPSVKRKKQTYFFLFFLFWKSVLIIIRNLKKNTDFYYFENSCKINNFIQMPVCKGTLKNIYGQLDKGVEFLQQTLIFKSLYLCNPMS